jgi:predicted nucleic acid-binding protein
MGTPGTATEGRRSRTVDWGWARVNAIVDTNVVAYYLLATEPFLEESRQFWRTVEEVAAPSHWEAELANAVWMAVETGVLPADEGHQKLDLAAQLGIESVPNQPLWQPALTRALDSGLAIYDTLFVELAVHRRLTLATFDRNVLKKFPEVARRPRDLPSK